MARIFLRLLLLHFDALDFVLLYVHFPFSQNQAKLFIEQKKIPFPVDNQNINEELGKLALYLKSDLSHGGQMLTFLLLRSYRLCSDRQRSLR